MKPFLHIYETPEETARGVAELMLKLAKEQNKKSLPFNVALSGGNTPKLLFTILANEFADSMPWHILRLFWVDERCVPPTDEESNYGMTYENLLKFVPIHNSNIFRISGENDPQKEANKYQQLLENQLPIIKGLPQFDLILLGMGDDGHTASIFPNNLDLLDVHETVAVATHPATGQQRITLTGNVINQSTHVVFFVTGSSKASVLSQIINHGPLYQHYPASYIHSQTGTAEFYVDKSATENY